MIFLKSRTDVKTAKASNILCLFSGIRHFLGKFCRQDATGRVSLSRASKWRTPLPHILKSIFLDVNPISSLSPHLPSSCRSSPTKKSMHFYESSSSSSFDSRSRDSIVNQLLLYLWVHDREMPIARGNEI